MIKENNKIIASPNKFLKIKGSDELRQSVFIGKTYAYINGKIQLIDISEENIYEVTPVVIDNEQFYISSTTYPEIVTELIRQKYSLDDELALMANARLGINKDYEEEFQAWRIKCKEAAKKIFK